MSYMREVLYPVNSVRSLSDSELVNIQPLFAEVFGGCISEELLRWKYAEGRGKSWCVLNDRQEVLLHCGVFYRNVVRFGRPERAGQLVDLMAAPKGKGLARGGADFSLLMRIILADLICADNPEGLAFGFPSGRAMRLGELSNVYCSVGEWLAMQFSPRFSFLAPHVEILSPENTTWDSHCDRLWSCMKKDFVEAVIGVRDSSFFRQRYFSRPNHNYVLLMVRSAILRKPIGMVAISLACDRCEILDLLSTREDMAVLLRGVQKWLTTRSTGPVSMMVASGYSEFLSHVADSVETTEFKIMANPFMKKLELEKLNDHWWLTGGDSDYR